MRGSNSKRSSETDTLSVHRQDESRPFRSTRRKQRGASLVECAITLAITCAAIYFAVNLLGLMADNSFKKTSTAMNGPSVESPNGDVIDSMAEKWPSYVASKTRPSYENSWTWIAVASVFISGLISMGLIQSKKRTKNKAQSLDDGAPSKEMKRFHQAIHEKRQNILAIFTDDMSSLLENRIEVQTLMSTKLVAVAPETTRKEIEKLFRKKQLRHLLVCNEDGNLLGIISDRDLSRHRARNAKDMMSPKPMTTMPNADISVAMSFMLNKHISCLPVVDGDNLVGVLTTTDLILALQCVTQILQRMAVEIQSPPDPASDYEQFQTEENCTAS